MEEFILTTSPGFGFSGSSHMLLIKGSASPRRKAKDGCTVIVNSKNTAITNDEIMTNDD